MTKALSGILIGGLLGEVATFAGAQAVFSGAERAQVIAYWAAPDRYLVTLPPRRCAARSRAPPRRSARRCAAASEGRPAL